MTEEQKQLLTMMFGPAAPILDLTTCARVLYKPVKSRSEFAWMPIGWETHQPMIFVQAQDEVKTLVNRDGVKEVEMVVRSYVNMDALSDELKLAVRQHLGLTKEGS